MVETQFTRWKTLSAILAPVGIAGKNVSTVQADALPGNAVILKETQHTRYLDLKTNTTNPVFMRLFESRLLTR